MLYDFKDPVLQIKGRTLVYIENYKKLLEYSKTQIKLLTKSGILEIQGSNLEMNYYSKEDLEIKGHIIHIHFLE